MDLPANFEFSQGNLQDYSDCRKRFLLRYFQQVVWPAVQAEPALENERHIQRGERFHRLVQQSLLGVPQERLAEIANDDPDPHLTNWWDNFVAAIQPDLNGLHQVELALTAPISGFRLIARYDLILAKPEGQFIIYDWKTNLTRSKRTWLSHRLQTLVYPYLLVRAGAALNLGKPIDPGQVSMVYWFAEFPHQPEIFSYSLDKFKSDHHTLEKLIAEVRSLPEPQFAMTSHLERCQYCVYRSLCDRGIMAGPLASHETDLEPDSDLDLTLDIDRISEIQY